jgi:hypothetical protein
MGRIAMSFQAATLPPACQLCGRSSSKPLLTRAASRAGLGQYEQANPLPPPPPPPTAFLVSMSMRGKLVWEPGMSDEESDRRMKEVIDEK